MNPHRTNFNPFTLTRSLSPKTDLNPFRSPSESIAEHPISQEHQAMLDRAVRLFQAGLESKDPEGVYTLEVCRLVERINPGYLTDKGQFKLRMILIYMINSLEAYQGEILPNLLQGIYKGFLDRQYLRQHTESKKLPALFFQGKFLEAMELADRLAEADLSPDNFRLSSVAIRILLGRWDEAWRTLPDDKLLGDIVGIPFWCGQSLLGKSILIWLKWSGNGDAVNFCWFIDILQDMGAARVSILTKPPIANLLKDSGFDAITEHDGENFDYVTNQMGLLKTLDFFPGKYSAPTRYLRIPKKSTAPIPKDDRLNVGVVWAASTFTEEIEQRQQKQYFQYRSIPLAQMAEHFQQFNILGIRFFSICHNPTEIGFDAATYPNLIDLSPHTKTFEDMAATIDELDLLVSVDTAHCHIAGALDRPCWTLLPLGCDWRWGATGNRTHWYDSMRLFRQESFDDWGKPLGQIREALADAVNSHQSRRSA